MNAPMVRLQLTFLAVAVVVVAGLTYRVVEIRQADVNTELVLGAAHGRRGPPLRLGHRWKRQRHRRQNHPAEDLPHTHVLHLGVVTSMARRLGA